VANQSINIIHVAPKITNEWKTNIYICSVA